MKAVLSILIVFASLVMLLDVSSSSVGAERAAKYAINALRAGDPAGAFAPAETLAELTSASRASATAEPVDSSGPAGGLRGDAASRAVHMAWALIRDLELAHQKGDGLAVDQALADLCGAIRVEDAAMLAILGAIEDHETVSDRVWTWLVQTVLREGTRGAKDRLHEILRQQEDEAAEGLPSSIEGIVGRLLAYDSPAEILDTLERLPDTASREALIVDALQQLIMFSNDPEVRALAFYRMQVAPNEESIQLFLDEIETGRHAEARVAAIRGLAESRSEDGAEVLLRILRDDTESPAARRFAASGLAHHAEVPGATAELIDLFWSGSDTSLRKNALSSVASHRSESATRTLVEVLERESDMGFRVAAAMGLMSSEQVPDLMSTLVQIRDMEGDGPVKFGLSQAIKKWSES